MDALTVGEWLLLGWSVPMVLGAGTSIIAGVAERPGVGEVGERVFEAGATGACVTAMTGALTGLYPTAVPPVVTAVGFGVIAILINIPVQDIQRLLSDQGGETA